jgi:hypothetical protein
VLRATLLCAPLLEEQALGMLTAALPLLLTTFG